MKVNVPVVMAREEVTAVPFLLNGIPLSITKLLYRIGLRIMEAVSLGLKTLTSACNANTTETSDPTYPIEGLPKKVVFALA